MIGGGFVYETSNAYALNMRGQVTGILMKLFKRIIKVIESFKVISNKSWPGRLSSVK